MFLSESAQAIGSAEGNTEFCALASGTWRPGGEGHVRATHYVNEATSEIPVVLVRRDVQSRRNEYARTSPKGEECRRLWEVGWRHSTVETRRLIPWIEAR